MINVSNVTKYYGDFCAVNDISFLIRRGEVTGLLGPNGAGKTTTLRMLTCYLKPTSGKINVGDYLVDENPIEVKKMIGYLPESAPLYGDMIVLDYLDYVGKINGLNGSDRIKKIAGICGINEVMHKNISELSKGYKQRVGLAHAMLHDPEILVLDEPTSGLDPNQIIEIRNLIKQIGKEKTVILSTHILSEVEATCDRVIIIDKGNIIADSPTAELKSHSSDDRTISVKLKGADYSEVSAELRSIPDVVEVREGNPEEGLVSLSVKVSGKSEIRDSIFERVKKRGWTLYEIMQEHKTLEHIFRELTMGGDNEI